VSIDEDPTKSEAAEIALGLPDPRLMLREQGVKGYLNVFVRRMKGGELGSIPVIVGLIVIWVVFQSLDSRFLSAANLSNLVQQMAPVGLISIGIVLVLLLGEIDLSVGSVSGLTSAILAVENINHGWATVPAIGAALLAGAVIGLVHGVFFAKIGVPAFVVTLAGLIGWQGLQLTVLGDQGTINFAFNGGIAKLANTYYTSEVGYGLVVIVIAGYIISMLVSARRRASAGLPARPVSDAVLRAALLAVALFVVVYVMNGRRQPGSGTAGRRERGHDPHHRLHARLDDGGSRRRDGGLAPVCGEPELGRQRRPAQRDRRSGDRRHEPVRRPRQHVLGAARHPRHPVDHERHAAAEPRHGRPLHDHGRGAAGRGDAGCSRAQGARGHW
jgi:D-xylose transport system permease protein